MNFSTRLTSSISAASVGGKLEADPRETLTVMITTRLKRGANEISKLAY